MPSPGILTMVRFAMVEINLIQGTNLHI